MSKTTKALYIQLSVINFTTLKEASHNVTTVQ